MHKDCRLEGTLLVIHLYLKLYLTDKFIYSKREIYHYFKDHKYPF